MLFERKALFIYVYMSNVYTSSITSFSLDMYSKLKENDEKIINEFELFFMNITQNHTTALLEENKYRTLRFIKAQQQSKYEI